MNWKFLEVEKAVEEEIMHQWKGETDIASIVNYAGVKNANMPNQMFDMAEQSYWEAADFSYMAPERRIVFNFEV